MRSFRTALLAAVAAAAFAGTAMAQSARTHVMTVALPGGGIAEIRYTGNVPPQVSLTDMPASLAAFDAMPALFGPDSPFAAMQRVSAEMDRQMAAMFAQADSLAARARSGSPQAVETAFGNMPPGSAGYSFVSTMSSNGVCTRSVEITSTGNGAAPKVNSHGSGDCAPATGSTGAAPANLPVARPPASPTQGPDLILTKATQPTAYTGMIRKVADSRR